MFRSLSDLPILLLSLPVVLLALSFHEMAHGYAAHLMGDNTARSFGRITLNPARHLDLIGTICMVIFGFGWAKPVPINSRNFKNPRKGMALTAIAGPLSNILLSLINVLLLRVTVLLFDIFWQDELAGMLMALNGYSYDGSKLFMVLAILAYVFYLGAYLNLSLAIFNLIPVPPLDGSRFFYIFLPPKAYFGVMKYEKYISLAIMILLLLGLITGPLHWVCGKILEGMYFITDMPVMSHNVIINFAYKILSR
jgi:Zn-dependent protease